MGLFLLVSGGLTCAFFLYVLAQFHRELKRTERGESSGWGAGLQKHARLASERRAESMDKKVRTILRKAVESGRARRSSRGAEISEAMPYIETVIPIGFVVTPVLPSFQPAHRGHPAKRIA